ncbi:MAG: hypothetical protein IT360_18795 [Gemmatimonadaceae bacterium]|nr:hypothetical protein [Gemmatimonadaceae bacterium]
MQRRRRKNAIVITCRRRSAAVGGGRQSHGLRNRVTTPETPEHMPLLMMVMTDPCARALRDAA